MSTAGKDIVCRAAVSWAPHQPMSIEEIVVAPPREGEVRIRMVGASLCHSDFAVLEGYTLTGFYEGQYPVVPGHEGVGVVESVGPGVTTLKPGDNVIPTFGPQCHKCASCASDKTNGCTALVGKSNRGLMADGTTRFKAKGATLYHMTNCSTFSEYIVSAEISVAKIPDGLLDPQLSLMGCGVPTGMGAALNEARVTPGSVCAVWGLGGVGLSAVLGCKLAGASTIVGVDLNPDKEAIARKFGCTDFVVPTALGKPINEYFAEKYNGGCDFTLETAGSTKAMEEAYASVRVLTGHCVVVGGVGPDKTISIKPLDLLFGRRISGCTFGRYKFRDDLPALVDLAIQGKIPIKDLITHTVRFEDVNEAVKILRSGKGARVSILF